MDNYSQEFSTICRLCLQNDDVKNMSSLGDIQCEKGLSLYGELLENLTSISVVINDILPVNICRKCQRTLDKIKAFKVMCIKNNLRLDSIVQCSLRKGISKQKMKEAICEYTMYSKYFPYDFEPSTELEVKTKTSNSKNNDFDFLKQELSNSYDIVDNKANLPDISYNTNNNDNNFDEHNNEENSYELMQDNIDSLLETMELCLNRKTKRKKRKKLIINRKMLKQNLTCNICKRTLANPTTYAHHMQRRHGRCRCICDQCGKGFPIMAELNMHQVTMHGISSSFKCDHCSFEAPRKVDLIEHIRLHTGERPFTCEKCGLTFRRQAIWKQHLKLHEEKTVQCKVCPLKFYNRGQMMAHMNNRHERMYLYLCRICEKPYAKTDTVRKHMLVKHGVPRDLQGKIIKVNKKSHGSLFRDRKISGDDTDV